MTDQDEAFRMLDTFASVGATHFDLTHINIEGEKRGFRPQQTLAQLKNSLPRLFPGATARQNNIIVRPHSDAVQLIQLDDLKADGLDCVRDISFLTLQTSPGNHQAWIAVSGLKGGQDTKEFTRRLRKGAGADPSASGATRIAGTANYKRKYEPDFPTLKILDAIPGRLVAQAELESRGILAPPEPPAVIQIKTSRRHTASGNERTWPDYERCVAGAPPSKEGDGPDRSMADFFWCMMAAQRGWSIEETASKLVEVSAKAQEKARLKDEGYARKMQLLQQHAADRRAGDDLHRSNRIQSPFLDAGASSSGVLYYRDARTRISCLIRVSDKLISHSERN